MLGGIGVGLFEESGRGGIPDGLADEDGGAQVWSQPG